MTLECSSITSVPNPYPIAQIYKDAAIKYYVQRYFKPGDVFDMDKYDLDELFSNKKLEEWALKNGFVKEKE